MLGSKAKRELKRNQRRILIDSIEIGIPSPRQIYTWGERQLPNGKKVGEIKNSKTVNYKRFTPLRDGLFCERIFGPVNSFVCACGKRQVRADVTFCEKCEVEYTDQRARRYNLGYIPLVSPVAHIWYLKGRPSYLSLFLGKRKKKVIALAYCNAYLVEQALYQTPNLALNDVMSRITEREAHGVNRYTKNIQSSPTVRHNSNLFYNSPKINLHTNQKIPVSFEEERSESTQFTNSLINATPISKSSALTNQKQSNRDKKDENDLYTNDKSCSSRTATNSSVEYASFNSFQQKINKKTSPSLFSHLLAEILGHIEKDIVLTDFSKRESTGTDQTQQTAYPLKDQASLLKKKESKLEALLSLRPLWGYTYSDQNNQTLRSLNTFTPTETLLNRAKESFGLRQDGVTVSIDANISTLLNKKSINSYTSPNISTATLFKEDRVASVSPLSVPNVFTQVSLLHHLYFAQEWNCLFGNLVCYKEHSIPTVLTLALNYTRKKSFQAGFTNSISQLSLKAVYEPLFLLPIERYYASILTFLGKGSKKLAFYLKKDWQLQESYSDNDIKQGLKVYHVPFSLFLMANLHTKSERTRVVTVNKQKYKDITSANEEKIDKKNKKFSSCWPFKHKIGANWQSATQNLYSNENKKIKTAARNNVFIPNVAQNLENARSAASRLDLSSSTHNSSLSITAQTPQRVLNPYNRAHTLPFLPSLICKYNLRDELLNLFNSSPSDGDRPIYPYCQLERWQALRDVHQFMSEQVLSQSTESERSPESINSDTPSIVTGGVVSSENAKQLASALQGQRFLNSITQSARRGSARRGNAPRRSVGENSPDMLLNNLYSKSKKINGFSLQNQDQRANTAWLKRTRDSARDATLLQVTERVAKEYTLSEKLASLRHILYIALLEKDFSLKAQELAVRAHKISCLYNYISREKLIYDSIHQSYSAEVAFNTDKDTKQNVTSKNRPTSLNVTRSIKRFSYNLRGSKVLRKRIDANTYTRSNNSYKKSVFKLPNSTVKRDVTSLGGSYKRNPDFGITTAENKSALTIQFRNFLQPVQTDEPLQEVLLSRKLRLRDKSTTQNKRIHPFHYLLRRYNSRTRYGGKLKDTLSSRFQAKLNASAGENSHLQALSKAVQFKKLSTVIGLANSLQLKSPERSYRSILFDRAWVRSFLLEKQLLDKKRYPAMGVNKLLSGSKSKNSAISNRDKLTLSPQIRPVPSYVHAFRQHANKKNQFNSYTLLARDAWPLKSTKTTLSKSTFDLEALDVKTPGLFEPIQAESIGKRVPFFKNSFGQQYCNIVNNVVKKSVGAYEKRLINKVYNLTFFLADNRIERKKTFSIYQLIPPPTKFIETVNHTFSYKAQYEAADAVLWNGYRRLGNASRGNAVRSVSTPDVELNLSGRAQQDKETVENSALSFFLVLPHSHKVQGSKTNRSLSTKKTLKTTGEAAKARENHTTLQIQLKNGNSKLINRVQIFLNSLSHHVQTDSDFLERAQTSSSNRSKLLKKSATESTSLLFNGQLGPTIELANTDALVKAQEFLSNSPLNDKNSLQSLYSQKSNTSGVYRVPTAYRNRNILSNQYNNNKKPLLEESDSVYMQDGYVANMEMLDRTNGSVKASPMPTSVTQHKAKSVSPSANLSVVSRQSSTSSSLELTTIREILSYTGGGALQKLLQRFDTQLFANFLFADIKATSAIYKQKVLQKNCSPSRIHKRVLTRLCRRIYKNSRRLKIAQLLTNSKRRPEWMMISVLPVLPPDLRPILQMSESVVVASDLNNLYQRVVYRNNRFYKLNFIDFYLVTAIQRLVQDAVDRLIENGKGGSKPFYTPSGRPLKSLSDTLKGKKGRFRLNLLGKRVDFSGRSVIVVSPTLKIHECGLPREIALELYHYFLLRQLMLRKQASSIIMAKKIIQQRDAFVWDVLREIVYHHPVLLNRAPTLHRLGIQAFQPKLVKGNAILLNPLVCSGFNADFDGDQMGVHLPLSTQARAEAWDLLWSRNNLLSPATGQPVLVPSQDMVLGFYYMTQSFSSRSLSEIKNDKKDLPLERKQFMLNAVGVETVDRPRKRLDQPENSFILRTNKPKDRRIPTARKVVSANRVFFNCLELLRAFQNKNIHLHTPVYLQWQGKMENDEIAQTPLELRINIFGSSTYIYSKYKRRKDESLSQSTLYIRTTAGRVLVNSILF